MTRFIKPAEPNSNVLWKGETFNAVIKQLQQQITALRVAMRNNRPTTVSVRNDTGANLEPHQVVALGDPLPLPGEFAEDPGFRWQHVFKGVASDSESEHFGITLEGIPRVAGQSAVGMVAIAGIATAYVNVEDLEHPYAKLSDTSGELESVATPTQIAIIYSPAVGTKQLCKVFLGSSAAAPAEGVQEIKLGVTINEVLPDTEGNVAIYDPTVCPPAPTAETLTGVCLDWLHGGEKISEDKECAVVRFSDSIPAAAQWQPLTPYVTGEQVSSAPYDGSTLINWTSKSDRVSGATWDQAEQANWDEGREVGSELWRFMWSECEDVDEGGPVNPGQGAFSTAYDESYRIGFSE